jgi:HK97 family phage portal protein
MLHIPGPGFDGLRGKSQIQFVLKTAAGIALAADQYSASFFKNGAKPDFAIEMEGKPTTEQIEEMRRVWHEKYGGIGKNHLPAVLFGGAKVHELTINAEDAQLIATRQFQVEDICRIFGVPPHMVGHVNKTTSWGSGIEHQGIGFVKFTMARHLTKIEQEVNRKTWPNGDMFCEFNTSGLERGDYKTRNEGYRIALGRAGEPAWMRVSEVRKLENLPPDEELERQAKGATDEKTPA